MAGLPDINVAGTLVADPELKYTPSGVAVANFTVAANDRRFNKDTNQWEDAGATFLRCSLWREPAEHAAESLTKGARVLLSGRLRQREWDDQDSGQKRYAFEVDVTEIGPSLRWATAKVTKATRNGTGGAAAATDPWASAPPSTAPVPDEPPF